MCRWLRGRIVPEGADLAVELCGRRLDHPVALAAGFDKDGVAFSGLFGLGFSAVELGSATPITQPGNAKPRLFRFPRERALINRMGMNNRGAVALAGRLGRGGVRLGLVGVNVAKNRLTPVEGAAFDYVRAVELLAPRADYVVLNVSSPNMPGLRRLEEPDLLGPLLQAVRARTSEVAPGCPLFLKIDPDLTPEALDRVVDLAVQARLDGIVATNTSVSRPPGGAAMPAEGGLSGAPLKDKSTVAVRRVYARAGKALVIIGVGGVFTAEDVVEKLCAGATLVQLYTALVYEGPGLVGKILRELPAALSRRGFSTVAEAIGADHARHPLKGRAPEA